MERTILMVIDNPYKYSVVLKSDLESMQDCNGMVLHPDVKHEIKFTIPDSTVPIQRFYKYKEQVYFFVTSVDPELVPHSYNPYSD